MALLALIGSLAALAQATALSGDWPSGPVTVFPSPKGVNSFDAKKGAYYGATVVAAAQYQARVLQPLGYDTFVLDGGWSSCPGGNQSMDRFGRPTPCAERYSNQTLKELAASVRAARVRNFGVWVIRGLPVTALAEDLPIEGSAFHMRDAARLDRNCTWDKVNVGVYANAAGRAWYESIFAHLMESDVDFVKIDCLYPSPNQPFNTEEVLMVGDVMREGAARSGFPLVVSFSPGGTVTTGNGSQIAHDGLATMYRATIDFWDVWRTERPDIYPSDLYSKPDVAHAFASHGLINDNGTFFDMDMLPLGRLGAHGRPQGGVTPVKGNATPTQFTAEEARFMMTMWLVARAPLMVGAYLPLEPSKFEVDRVALELLTNRRALEVHDCSAAPRMLRNSSSLVVWGSVPTSPCSLDGSKLPVRATASATDRFVAVLNRGDSPERADVTMASLGLAVSGGDCYAVQELWTGRTVAKQTGLQSFSYTVGAHDGTLFAVKRETCA